jgi:hypothetical protein
MNNYLNQTEEYILPMAIEVNKDMAVELIDLIYRKETNELVQILAVFSDISGAEFSSRNSYNRFTFA